MMNKKEILEKFHKIDDKTLLARILDKAAQAEKLGVVTYSDFLDPYQQKIVTRALHGQNDIEYQFDGGSERNIILFDRSCILNYSKVNKSANKLGNEMENELESPIKLLNIKLKTDANLSHRDYLGSLMGLGIKREKIGDIITQDNSATVVVLKDVAEYILYNLLKIGRINVIIEYGNFGDIITSDSKDKDIRCTVPSLRLDCIVSQGFGLSRSKVVPLFSAHRVFLNWEPEDSLSAQVEEGDVVSIKGKGRIILSEIGKTTRKDRIAIVIKKLI